MIACLACVNWFYNNNGDMEPVYLRDFSLPDVQASSTKENTLRMGSETSFYYLKITMQSYLELVV